MSSFQAIYRVWLRYFDVFRKSWLYGIITTFLEPLLYLAAFGFGVGSIVGTIEVQGVVVSYRQFVFAGIAAQSILFQSFFEASYGSFVRMYYQRIFQAIAMTPITLREVLWGELLWDASRGTVSATVIYLIGSVSGDFRPMGVLLALPVAFAGSILFASLGLLVAAKSPSIDAISYPQYLFIFPMFLFGGVFFPLENLPGALQWAVWVFPLTPLVSLIRTLLLGFELEPQTLPLLALWTGVLVVVSRRAMTHRLVK